MKAVVWDLDQTLWQGVLLEDEEVRPDPALVRCVHELDRRGILHSVASRNDHDPAWERLTRLGLADYFIHPRIGWGAKSDAVGAIAADLGIALDSVVFVDDDPLERAEVAFGHPQVRCFSPEEAAGFPDEPAFAGARTAEAAGRRRLYQQESDRSAAEQSYEGPPAEFLASLDLTVRVQRARRDDLARLHELTVRTNQLNSTGHTYDEVDLARCIRSDRYELLVAEVSDRFGSYGKVGLALVERDGDVWVIKLLLTSCRVLSRGVGSILLTFLVNRAASAGAALRADFVDTGRNRPMYVAFRLAGFRAGTAADPGATTLLERDRPGPAPFPGHVAVEDLT